MTRGYPLIFFFSPVHRSIGDESSSREIFEEYITYLKEKAKEKERKREEEKVQIYLISPLSTLLDMVKLK